MPVVNRIADYAEEMKTWRRHLHQIPELGLDLPKTSAYVAERLREIGVDEIHEGIAEHGIVAIINGQGAGGTIGLRADMDALPMTEETGLEYQSGHAGKMHACGHDGHTTMLLGAAKYLAETRKFSGRVALLFQPAEEIIGGARIMVEEGVMDRFEISSVYALHNAPGLPVGAFQTTPGPIMAAVDDFTINIKGLGGHAAMPHETRDPVMAACGMAQAIQTILSRNAPPLEDLVISVTQIHTGSADNVIPETAFINGTIRTFNPQVREMAMKRMGEVVTGCATAYDVTAEIDFAIGYPATVNDADKTRFAVDVAQDIAGADNVEDAAQREMGAEDFAYMLEARPGAYLFLGQGDTAGVHHPAYDFNDEISPVGASFFAKLVEKAQPLA